MAQVLAQRPVLYPNQYVWYVFASSLDIMVTVFVLSHLGMREANTFAQWSITQFGTWGLIGLKFITVALVVCVCEFIGRRNHVAGRRLACWSILASLLPVLAALAQVGYLLSLGDLEWTVLPATQEAIEHLAR
ncbi:MAG: hypothetical protein IT434_09980 [Phycisphaerales bacterium]|jgi:uncharacterized membrane protein|nr:hypothetical protein [Phycisphaerales bacterium]